jgi:hypothetical protein
MNKLTNTVSQLAIRDGELDHTRLRGVSIGVQKSSEKF